jgi:hypothetical protein
MKFNFFQTIRVILIFTGFCLGWWLGSYAFGQELPPHYDHPEDLGIHQKFYKTWNMPDQPDISCCNDADCYPTEAKMTDGHWWAKRREDGKWIKIPDEKVEKNRNNPDGRNHICAPPPGYSLYSPPSSTDTVFCFIPGGGT